MSSNINIETARDLTDYLAKVLRYEYNLTDEEEEFWSKLVVSTPIVNNFIIAIPGGKQYNVQVKPVS